MHERAKRGREREKERADDGGGFSLVNAEPVSCVRKAALDEDVGYINSNEEVDRGARQSRYEAWERWTRGATEVHNTHYSCCSSIIVVRLLREVP